MSIMAVDKHCHLEAAHTLGLMVNVLVSPLSKPIPRSDLFVPLTVMMVVISMRTPVVDLASRTKFEH